MKINNLLKKNPSIIKKGIVIHPGYPFFYDGVQVWKSGQNSLLKEALLIKKSLPESLFSLIWIIEKVMINSLIVLFFPILGLVLAIYWRGILNKNPSKFLYNERVILLTNYASLAFIFGVSFTFFLSFNGYKWEFSRFMVPFITFGMIAYFVTLWNFLKLRKIFYFFIFISLIGPIFSQSLKSQKNIFNIPQDKINLFFSSSQKDSESICNEY